MADEPTTPGGRRPARREELTIDTSLLHDAVLTAAIACSRRGADPPTRGDLRLSRLG